jgi:hypothetical protein
MADKLNRLAPIGNLDTDSDPRYVGRGEGRTGDTTQNRNTQIAGDAGSTSGDITPTLGTLFGFDLGEVSAQNKKYRLTFSGDATKSHQIRLLSTNRDANVANGSGTDGGIPFNGTQADFITQWNASNTANMLATYPTATTAVIEMVSYDYYQFYIESTGTDDIEVVCIQEAIPVDLAGPLKDIGSYDLLGDLFVFSTTQDNEPTELDLTVTSVLPITAGVHTGPLTFLTFNQPHGLVAGQWIRITNSNAPWLNGLFVVAQINNATQIGIPTVLAWGGTRPLFTIGSETVRIHPMGIGEIGVAQKDDNTDAWTYTRLLRSVELNFVSKWTIDCHSHKDQLGVNIYYTDDYNQPRKFTYRLEYLTDGAMNFVAQQNIYRYDEIFGQSALILTTPVVKFEFISQNQTGGQLKAGNKYYHVRLLTSAGDTSRWSAPSNAINVYKESTQNSTNSISGNNSIVTTKSNKLRIIGLNPNVTDNIEIAVIEEISGVLTASIIKRITVISTTVEFTHTGNELLETVDIGEFAILSDSSIPIKAKSISSVDSRNVITNIETLDKIDLSEWMKTFKHSIKRKYITEATGYQEGEYQEPQSVFDSVGFMLNETYRVGCRAYITGLGRTDVFWVDDIKVDTNLINTANPDGDNRRTATIPNFDLSEQIVPTGVNLLYAALTNQNPNGNGLYTPTGTPNDPLWEYQSGVRWDTGWESYEDGEFFNDSSGNPLGLSSVSRLIVPYIEIEDIDYGFVIPSLGVSAAQAVEALEFFIADKPAFVKASGIGIMSVKVRDDSNNVFNNPLDAFALFPTNEDDSYVIEYPHATGSADFLTVSTYEALNYPLPIQNPTFPPSVGFNSAVRDIVSFYSGDTVFSDSDFSADSLLVFGAMELKKNIKTRLIASDFRNVSDGTRLDQAFSFWANFHPTLTGSSYKEYPIEFQDNIDPEKLPDIRTISYDKLTFPYQFPGQWYYGFGGDAYRPTATDLYSADLGGIKFSKRLPKITTFYDTLTGTATGNTINCSLSNTKGPVVKLAAQIDFNEPLMSPSFINNNHIFRYSNRGAVYCQLYADQSANMPAISQTEYKPLGSLLITPNTLSSVSHPLNCGDTFTQTTIIKHRAPDITKDNVQLAGDSAYDVSGLGNTPEDRFIYAKEINQIGACSGLIVVCQNRVNANMYTTEEDQTLEQIYYPKDGIKEWTTSMRFDSIQKYNTAYTENLPLRLSAYFTLLNGSGALYDFPTRIMYSLRKDQSGIYDEYRLFLPLDIKDLDFTFGEINNHEDIGGELFTVQPRKYQLQYFNARGTLEASSSSVEVLIGDGSVLSRDGQTLSSYGTQHKWSCIKGLNANGKDVLYWFNAENGLVMRFGEDGTRVISARGMAAFFANYTKWVKNKDEHAFEQGIRGVWDDRRKEAIWTFTGWRLIKQPWASGNLVEEGEVVTNTNAPFDTYEEFPRFFRCTATHQSSSATEPGVGPQWEHRWEAIAYTDKSYYSIFTICFNEMTNGFRCFYGHLPKTYLRWQNTFLSSHPVHRNLIFEHRLGEPTTWYGVDTFLTGTIAPKVEDAYFEMVVNEIPEQSFGGVAVDALTENAPDRVEYRTARQYTFDNAVDFEQRDDQFYSCIKNDATLTNNPDSDGEYLRGDFLKVKVFIFGGTYNLFHSIVVKIRESLRRTNT